MEIQPAGISLHATGKLYASIVDAATNYESCRVEDTVRGIIEVKFRKAVSEVNDAAVRRNIENELRAEREAVRRRKSQKWGVAKAHTNSRLKLLASFEKMATDLDRARSLRRLTDEIVASKAAPAELVGSLELMALMADWLDPMVKAPWPEVDGVGKRNPHGSLW